LTLKEKENIKILLQTDDAQLELNLKNFLERKGCVVFEAGNRTEAVNLIEERKIDVVISDLRVSLWDVFALLKLIKSGDHRTELIILTALGGVDDASNLIKSGAFYYLTKPVNLTELQRLLEILLQRKEFIAENVYLKKLIESAKIDIAFLPKTKLLEPENYTVGFSEKTKEYELLLIHTALEKTKGNKSAAARLLGITERHLRSRLERLGNPQKLKIF